MRRAGHRAVGCRVKETVLAPVLLICYCAVVCNLFAWARRRALLLEDVILPYTVGTVLTPCRWAGRQNTAMFRCAYKHKQSCCAATETPVAAFSKSNSHLCEHSRRASLKVSRLLPGYPTIGTSQHVHAVTLCRRAASSHALHTHCCCDN
ncbi:hypothetical protein DAEQUDRAFT_150440 [Daedalea quercina L-15889]|uniref:Uncharacterized protein n=1 Tax=Daedalea quercina L-15889 TaxID=1314783 RepID=A0A165KLV8_9APHY|nr:hypothetical protein DAEQUDRAFT_150440 [Daedalea quercina L-15889]